MTAQIINFNQRKAERELENLVQYRRYATIDFNQGDILSVELGPTIELEIDFPGEEK